MHRTSLPALALGFAVVLVGGRADAALVGNDFASGRLYDVDLTTGAATNPRETGVAQLADVEASPDGAALYGLSAFSTANANTLYRIDPRTGLATAVGSTGLFDIYEGDLAFQPGTGVLFGVQHVPLTPGTARNLFRLSLATGQATVVGSILTTANSDLSAMAFAADGTLFVLDTINEQLLTVSPSTAAVTRAVATSVPLGATAGMARDPATGTLYVVDGGATGLTTGTDSLYTLDPGTGVLTLVGPTGLADGLGGLAYVPEPSALAAAGTAASALACRRRRRQPAVVVNGG